ncbi:MAG: hypothetical protein DYG94_04235 [Leptolyngbya sp. PLA3]|nr:MAG: hypothetical protein EDM82_07660 [Cyanobacteria bacterium CYA]MCE7967940.1 hypothetical protein [Leptolyngbya sp. PL-A3]
MVRAFLLVLAAGAPVALAQQFEFTVTSGSATIEGATTITTAGSLIGDYDVDTNPEGTQTRAGLFGGSGNNAIPASADFLLESGGEATPTGTFVLSADVGAGTVTVSGLSLDLLGGEELAAELAVALLYQTFHTVSPSFIYPGGVPITLPLGQLGAITGAAVEQTDPGVGVLTPTADPNVFDLAVAAPAAVTLVVELTPIGGDPVVQEIGPFPAVFPLTGQLVIVDESTAQISLVVEEQASEQVLPIDPALELPGLPLELPTLGSATAGVVLTLSADSLTIATTLGASLTATGVNVTCAADWNGDGNLNFFDVQGFLGDFSAHDAAADLVADGQFNFFDVQVYLSLFSAGCSDT